MRWNSLGFRCLQFAALRRSTPQDISASASRLTRIAMSVYGYYKRVAALYCLRHGKEAASRREAADYLEWFLRRVDDPLTWALDVEKRRNQMRLGQW
jgi:hypothetical protein